MSGFVVQFRSVAAGRRRTSGFGLWWLSRVLTQTVEPGVWLCLEDGAAALAAAAQLPTHILTKVVWLFFCFKLCIILKPVKLLGMWILLEVRMLQLCKNCVYPSANTLKCLLVHHICITLSFKNPGYVKSSICKTWVLEVAALGSVCAGPAGPVMIQYRAKREQVTVGGWAACAPCFSFLLLFLPSALTSFLLLSALFFPAFIFPCLFCFALLPRQDCGLLDDG